LRGEPLERIGRKRDPRDHRAERPGVRSNQTRFNEYIDRRSSRRRIRPVDRTGEKDSGKTIREGTTTFRLKGKDEGVH